MSPRNDAAFRERSETQMVEYGTRMRRERDAAHRQLNEIKPALLELWILCERGQDEGRNVIDLHDLQDVNASEDDQVYVIEEMCRLIARVMRPAWSAGWPGQEIETVKVAGDVL